MLGEVTIFPRSPLDGEGATALFAFESSRGSETPEDYYVAVGQTEPNYYAAAGLDAEDVFSLHVGTRFMLVMGVAQSPVVDETYDAYQDARTVCDRVAPRASLEDVQVAATFDVEGQMHRVLRARFGGDAIYLFAGDAPWGFSRRVDLPPHVVYRLHLGRVLRAEPDPNSTEKRRPGAP
jgi:hypothetical protein